ncbi:hypothetical protein HYT23_01690 [Candidatus Pacearchaeota archaeon]|nr:hypothetical protein [Candidatus Pacearchaeota archaeon]
MLDLASQLKVPITEKDRKDAWKELTNSDSGNPKFKVVFFDLGLDDATNVRVYDFLASFMHESRIIVVGGAQGLEKYIPMPRIHDYTGVDERTISYGRRLHGEECVKRAFSSLAANQIYRTGQSKKYDR